MSLLSTAVRVAITGEVSVAPTGSTAPTNSSSALDAAFVGLGYVGEDGVKVTPSDSTDTIRAWQYAAAVRTVFTGTDWTFQFKLIETKGKTVALFFRSTVATVSAGEWSILPDATNPDQRAFSLDVVDGSKNYRYYIPLGEVIERSEITLASGEAIGYEVTIKANYSSALGAPFKVFSNDTMWGYS